MDLKRAIAKLCERQTLTAEEMTTILTDIFQGHVQSSQLAAFLVALHLKGETATEILAGVKILRQYATSFEVNAAPLVDIVGTGGDGVKTFNISTVSAVVAAAAGVVVAKHGSGAVSSCSGSADVLSAAGLNLDMSVAKVTESIEELGLGFLYAPLHNSAMRQVTDVRRQIGIKTYFNLLGPLINPVNVSRQVLGVYAADLLIPVAEALQALGSEHALVIHSNDGLDEISIAADTKIIEIQQGQISDYKIMPEDFNLQRQSLTEIKADSAEESLAIIKMVLNNKPGPAHDIVILNAGAAIYVSGLVSSLAEGVQQAKLVISTGLAKDKFKALIEFSQAK